MHRATIGSTSVSISQADKPRRSPAVTPMRRRCSCSKLDDLAGRFVECDRAGQSSSGKLHQARRTIELHAITQRVLGTVEHVCRNLDSREMRRPLAVRVEVGESRAPYLAWRT
jgi:hypothetical protein